jgi:hypothetical protein
MAGMEESGTRSSALRSRVQEAWKDVPPIRNEEIVEESYLPGDIEKARAYFTDRLLSEIDLSDPAITNEYVFFEAFTLVAKHYYSAKYLEYLLDAYGNHSSFRGGYAAEHFLHFLLSRSARNPRIGYSREQAAVIADVLDYVAERIDPLELYDGEDGILEAMYYWRERGNERNATWGKWCVMRRCGRIVSLLLMVFCVITWVGSHWYTAVGPVHLNADAAVGAAVFRDEMEAYWIHDPSDSHMSWALYATNPSEVESERVENDRCGVHGFGFAFGSFDSGCYVVEVPMWFSTSLSGIFAWYVWRRGGHNVLRAFPVEGVNGESGRWCAELFWGEWERSPLARG